MKKEPNLIQLMSTRGFVIFNRKLAHRLGMLEAVIIGELCSEYDYWATRGKLVEGKYFFSTYKNLEEQLGIPRRTQSRKLQKLEKLEIIETKLIGMPAKKYYTINIEKLLEYAND